MQPNPELPEAGGVKLAANEKEVLLLELFPQVAKNFLTKQKVAAYEAQHKADAPQAEKVVAEEKKNEPITGKTVKAPMPGSITLHRKTRRYGNQKSDCSHTRSHENGKQHRNRLCRYCKTFVGKRRYYCSCRCSDDRNRSLIIIKSMKNSFMDFFISIRPKLYKPNLGNITFSSPSAKTASRSSPS